jgi:1,4-dihydroxy-2-naphthoyl-CoA hydrolase
MTPLEKVNSMKMPFAELKGVTFTEAEKDRVVARMLVRPDLCTLGNTLHGGAIMALADSVGAAATVINLPEDAKGTTTIESKTNFIGGAKEGMTVIATATPVHRGRRTQVWQPGSRPRRAAWLPSSRRRRWCCSRANAARSQSYAASAACTAFNIPVCG